MRPQRTNSRAEDPGVVAHTCSNAHGGVSARSAGVFLSVFAAWVWSAGVAEAQVIRQDFYATNGTVHATALSGNTLYIGGQFTHVGHPTGGGVPIDAASGIPVSGFPRVAGYVFAVAPDGAGGWYIGGSFYEVAGIPRSNLAHILADNTVSPWDPNANGEVHALVLNGRTIYAGGFFGSVGGATRSYIAAIDVLTGLATAWDPNADNAVAALALSGTTIYASGDFTGIGGQTRNYIAALDSASGLATAWDPNPNGGVSALAVSGTTVYAGGCFSRIGGEMRNSIAALDDTMGHATAWDPNANHCVGALTVSGTTVYAGGFFTSIGAQTRTGIAALDVATGLATAWDPNTGGTSAYVIALAVSGTTVYAAGYFTSMGGQARNYIAALDATTGLANGWNPNASAFVNALAASGTTVYAGGAFNIMGGLTRHNLAALDVTTGIATAWDPDVKNMVQSAPGGPPGGVAIPAKVSALAVGGSAVYVGGTFSVIGDTATSGAVRNNIAALDAATGLPTAWNPDARLGTISQYGSVAALVVSGSTVYVGGRFTRIGGQTRNYIAALDAATGEATPWNPSANDSIAELALSGTTVYTAGTFNRIGAQTRNGLAALGSAGVDSTTGIVTAWDPKPFPGSVPGFRNPDGSPIPAFGPVRALAVSGTIVYAGGSFEFFGGGIGGPERHHIAALDATTGLATSWNPSAGIEPGLFIGPRVSAIAVSGSTVYVGGLFGSIGGQTRHSLAALDATTGLATEWDPNAIYGVNALSLGGTTVYAGGSFGMIGGLPLTGIAAISDVTTPTLLSLVSAEAEPDRVRLKWFAANNPGLVATVYRRTETGEWKSLGQVAADGTGRMVHEDTQVTAGARYGYRLGVTQGEAEEFLGETWVNVPRAPGFTLAGARPNPAGQDLTVALSLPDASPARLELVDLAGRRVFARDVGRLGAGNHVVHVAHGHTLVAGVYLLRLTRGAHSLTTRAVIVR